MTQLHSEAKHKSVSLISFDRRESVIWWPLFRFFGLAGRALVSSPDRSCAPVPDLVLRVAIAGHVKLPEADAVTPLVDQVLKDLRDALLECAGEYGQAFGDTSAKPAVDCRMLSQLAAGADQFVAGRALLLNYTLQTPLPVTLDEFAADVQRNPGLDKDPAGNLRTLAGKARVLELEEAGTLESVSDENYANAALTMLEHCDILLALVRGNANPAPPGTKWLMDEATRRGKPMIEIRLDDPQVSQLWNASKERNAPIPLTAKPGWAKELVRSLVLPPAAVPQGAYPRSGWFVERFRRNVTAHVSEWPPNWEDATRAKLVSKESRNWVEDVTSDYFRFWYWGEHRANTYRNLYQGAYVTMAMLGLCAVLGALVSAITENEAAIAWGKIAEIAAIGGLIWLWLAAKRGHWRERWISYRLLEQQIRNASVLELVGRTIPALASPAISDVQKEGAWLTWYLNAVLRQANLPQTRLDQNHLRQAGLLMLHGQIQRQIDYYDKAIWRSHAANHRLETWAISALCGTALCAVAYVFGYFTDLFHYHALHVPALVTGLFFPAMAASLAAIRAQGELPQLEKRYTNTKTALEAMQAQLGALLEDADANGKRLKGKKLGEISKAAAEAMLDEVNQWRTLLYTNAPDV